MRVRRKRKRNRRRSTFKIADNISAVLINLRIPRRKHGDTRNHAARWEEEMSFEAITINSEEELKSYLKENNLMTQDEVNKLVGSEKAKAKERAEKDAAEKYAGFDDYKSKAEKYDSDIASKDGKIKDLEDKVRKYESDSVKTKIARAVGLPAEMADRLRGETEEEMKADAEGLAKFMTKKEVAPLGDPDPNGAGEGDAKRAAYLQMSKELKGEE